MLKMGDVFNLHFFFFFVLNSFIVSDEHYIKSFLQATLIDTRIIHSVGEVGTL